MFLLLGRSAYFCWISQSQLAKKRWWDNTGATAECKQTKCVFLAHPNSSVKNCGAKQSSSPAGAVRSINHQHCSFPGGSKNGILCTEIPLFCPLLFPWWLPCMPASLLAQQLPRQQVSGLPEDGPHLVGAAPPGCSRQQAYTHPGPFTQDSPPPTASVITGHFLICPDVYYHLNSLPAWSNQGSFASSASQPRKLIPLGSCPHKRMVPV